MTSISSKLCAYLFLELTRITLTWPSTRHCIFPLRHPPEPSSQKMSNDDQGLEQGGDYIEETKPLGPAMEGTTRAIRITISFHVPNADQWYPLAYEVESLIPIVLHAEKYSRRQSQA